MNLDILLQYATQIAWVILALSAVLIFIARLRRIGVQSAMRSLVSWRLFLPLLLVIVVNLVSLSLIFVPPQQVGVVISLIAPKGIRERALTSGLHWLFPLLEEAKLYPIYWQTYTMALRPMEGQEVGNDSIAARTSDGQEVHIDSSVIFKIDPDQVIRVHIEWQDRYISDLIRPAARGFVRFEVSQFTVEEVNSSQRRTLQQKIEASLRQELEDKGLVLDKFLLRNITFSGEYAASVEQKQVALEAALQRQYEADQMRELARGQADKVRIEAAGRADAIIIEADAEAEARIVLAEADATALTLINEILERNPDLLTYRYIDKLSPNIRAMLLPSDTPLYLPVPDGDNMLSLDEEVAADGVDPAAEEALSVDASAGESAESAPAEDAVDVEPVERIDENVAADASAEGDTAAEDTGTDGTDSSDNKTNQ
ncbi:MAG: prohibitin family protein [Chloroflexota bacterium]